MAEFIARTIVDQEVEHEFRYALKDISTGNIIMTVDIVPTWRDNPAEVLQEPTDIDAEYLQRFEDFLQVVGIELKDLDDGLKSANANILYISGILNDKITSGETSLNTKIASTESTLNTKIASTESTLNTKITSTDTTLSGRITSSNNRIGAIEAALPTKAPLVNALLTSPTLANRPDQGDNSTRLTDTAWVRTYFSSLMSAYTG